MASGADALEFAALVPSRWIVMIRRAIPAFVTLIALSQTATAGVPLFGHVSCGVVRFYVAKYSQAAAEKWARGHGAGKPDPAVLLDRAGRVVHHNAAAAQLAPALRKNEQAQFALPPP